MSKYQTISFLPQWVRYFLFSLVKLAIVVGAGLFIYDRLVSNETLDFVYFIKILEENNILTIRNGVFLIGFSVLNWFFESLKWSILVNEFKTLSIGKAMEQTLGALTASIVTPNRIGEYGAKAIYYPKKYRKKILGLTLIGNLEQLIITVVFGVFGVICFINTYNHTISYYKVLQGSILVVLLFYFFVIYIPKKEFTIKGYSFVKLKNFLKSISIKTLLMSLSLAFLRYVIFSHQFYFLIWLFGINVSYIDVMVLITSMYLLVSIIPTIFILDVLVKGSVAVWLFSFVGANEFIVLSVITLMWLLNFALPSIFGSYFVLNFKMNTSK